MWQRARATASGYTGSQFHRFYAGSHAFWHDGLGRVGTQVAASHNNGTVLLARESNGDKSFCFNLFTYHPASKGGCATMESGGRRVLDVPSPSGLAPPP